MVVFNPVFSFQRISIHLWGSNSTGLPWETCIDGSGMWSDTKVHKWFLKMIFINNWVNISFQGTFAGIIFGLTQLNCSELKLRQLCYRQGCVTWLAYETVIQCCMCCLCDHDLFFNLNLHFFVFQITWCGQAVFLCNKWVAKWHKDQSASRNTKWCGAYSHSGETGLAITFSMCSSYNYPPLSPWHLMFFFFACYLWAWDNLGISVHMRSKWTFCSVQFMA